MNLEDYIASGMLESYAMGLCTDAEKAEVESMLLKYPGLRDELNEIEKGLYEFGQANAIAPSANIKKKLLAQLEERKPETPVIPLQPAAARKKINWLAAASIVLLVSSVAMNVMLYNKYQHSQTRLASLQNENSAWAGKYEKTQADYKKTNEALASVSSPMTKMVEMKGLPNSPESKAMIFWNKQTSEVYMSVMSLPVAPSDMQYQLWAIVDGAPVDAGMIDITKGDLMPHKMKNFENAQAFAVTLERKGGSPTPTMEAMYVMGAVEG